MGEVVLSSRAEEWEFVVAKARAWLASMMAGDQNPESIIAQARDKMKPPLLMTNEKTKAHKLQSIEIQAQGKAVLETGAAKTTAKTGMPKPKRNMINYEEFVKMMMSK